jgi:hypothetical protein
MNLNGFENIIGTKTTSNKMPISFVGHGNSLYIISNNKYRLAWQ